MIEKLGQDTMEVSLNEYSYEEGNFYHINNKPNQNFSLENNFKQDEQVKNGNNIESSVIDVNIKNQNRIEQNIEDIENEKDNMKEEEKERKGHKKQIQSSTNKKASEWRNELLSLPQLFNQVFLSLYRFNEYIDQRWSVLDESHNRLYNLLLELSKANSNTNNLIPNNFDNIFIVEKFIHNKYVSLRFKNINNNLMTYFKTTSIYIPGTEFNYGNINHENEYKIRLYEDIYNRFQTCKNDIEITFERKSEMITELDSRIKRIVSSIEKFINNNQYLLESHTRPLYNIDNNEICEIGTVKRKTGVRGRPPGSGNRGRPPGSTKKVKKIQN